MGILQNLRGFVRKPKREEGNFLNTRREMNKGRFFLNIVEKVRENQCERQVIKTMSPPLRVSLREAEGRRKEGKGGVHL